MTIPTAIPHAMHHLAGFLAAHLGPSVAGEVYYGAAPVGVPLPCIVWHSQDGGGQRQGYIGQELWTGAITIRAFASSHAAAEALGIQIAETLPGRYDYATAVIGVRLVKPLPITPTLGSPLWAYAFLYTITITGG